MVYRLSEGVKRGYIDSSIDNSTITTTCLNRIVLRIDCDGADGDVANVHAVVDGVRQFRFVQRDPDRGFGGIGRVEKRNRYRRQFRCAITREGFLHGAAVGACGVRVLGGVGEDSGPGKGRHLVGSGCWRRHRSGLRNLLTALLLLHELLLLHLQSLVLLLLHLLLLQLLLLHLLLLHELRLHLLLLLLHELWLHLMLLRLHGHG